MNRGIPSNFIDELILKTDIVTFISKNISLKQYGKYYRACCPFHNEKTPSFTVNRNKKFYYCFGCGIHGNVIDFLINYKKLTFLQSIEELSSMHGLIIPYKIMHNNYYQIIEEQKTLYTLMDYICRFYINSLNECTLKLAKLYLYKRGLTDNIIKYFCIGFAPNGYNVLINNLITKNNNYKTLESTGMFLRKKSYLYDYFRNRIVFPIRNIKGLCVGFGGRSLNNERPKYLNSAESKIFNKSKELYGLYEIIHNNKMIPKLLIVEGYMDVISLTQFGIDYSVSSLGTSTTIEHMKLLFQITDIVICCYDGDQAGRQAAWRALKISLSFLTDGKKIQFVFLPEGEDPDSLIRKEGKLKFEKRLENASSLSSFLFEKLCSNINLVDYEDKAKFNRYAMLLIKKIPSEILKVCLLQRLSKIIGIPDIAGILYLYKNDTSIVLNSNPNCLRIKLTTMRILITLLIKYPKFVNLINNINIINEIDIPGLKLFLEIVEICKSNPAINTTELLEYYRENNIIVLLMKLIKWNDVKIDYIAEKMFKDALYHLNKIVFNKRFDILINKERNIGLTDYEKKEVNLIAIARNHKSIS
uniref:DNA primase n=1 Tax=Candidatus Aschnera chinzeii TaxID=1485666 RepID=A0AAT9G4E3_9ENTR|nr:MAG: DNA primase [Candidatus Aschnera chinzeii]